MTCPPRLSESAVWLPCVSGVGVGGSGRKMRENSGPQEVTRAVWQAAWTLHTEQNSGGSRGTMGHYFSLWEVGQFGTG